MCVHWCRGRAKGEGLAFRRGHCCCQSIVTADLPLYRSAMPQRKTQTTRRLLNFTDFVKPVRVTLRVAKPNMVPSRLLLLLNQVIHYSAGSLLSDAVSQSLFCPFFSLFSLKNRQILCCTNFHFLPFTFCLSLCSGAFMACHNRVVLAIALLKLPSWKVTSLILQLNSSQQTGKHVTSTQSESTLSSFQPKTLKKKSHLWLLKRP